MVHNSKKVSFWCLHDYLRNNLRSRTLIRSSLRSRDLYCQILPTLPKKERGGNLTWRKPESLKNVLQWIDLLSWVVVVCLARSFCCSCSELHWTTCQSGAEKGWKVAKYEHESTSLFLASQFSLLLKQLATGHTHAIRQARPHFIEKTEGRLKNKVILRMGICEGQIHATCSLTGAYLLQSSKKLFSGFQEKKNLKVWTRYNILNFPGRHKRRNAAKRRNGAMTPIALFIDSINGAMELKTEQWPLLRRLLI